MSHHTTPRTARSRSARRSRLRYAVGAGVGTLGLLALTACGAAESGSDNGGSGGDGEGSGYDEVVIAQPNWVGAAANAAVAAHVLENELDIDTTIQQIDETLAWDGLDDGSIQAILEDWGGAPEKEELYLEEKGSVVHAGDLGVVGHIGWYVPKAYADENPEILDWENLNDFAEDFQTAESGDQGQLLNGDPGFTSYDSDLVANLDLDFQVVEGGSEEALISAIERADRDGTPLLTYFWEPHWLNAEVELVEVELPPYDADCHGGGIDAADITCGYPEEDLPKYFGADFDENGGVAAEFLRNFQWDTADQEEVSRLIQQEGMSGEEAAAEWVADNPEKVEAWLPEQD